MLPVIENLLILQDRDRKILTLLDELAHIGPERDSLRSSLSSNQAALDAAKQKVMHLESDRKKLELDVEAKKQQIEKYSIQQFQTKKNEEFKAFEHEIATCKGIILTLDDQQIELMEQIETAPTAQAEGPERPRRHPARRVRRLPHATQPQYHFGLPGRSRDRHLPELQPHPLLHPRHGSGSR